MHTEGSTLVILLNGDKLLLLYNYYDNPFPRLIVVVFDAQSFL